MKYLVYTLLVLACVGSLVRAESINWNSTDWDARIANEAQQQIMRKQMENIADEAAQRAVVQGLLMQGYTPTVEHYEHPINNSVMSTEFDLKTINELDSSELELCSNSIYWCPNQSTKMQEEANDKVVDKAIEEILKGAK